MNFQQTFERIEMLHTLIAQKKTGAPDVIAKRLGISRSCLYLMIDELNAMNMRVNYSRKQQTFYYPHKVELILSFKVNNIESTDELRNFNGGSIIFFVPSNFLDGTNLSLSSYLAEYKEPAHRLISCGKQIF